VKISTATRDGAKDFGVDAAPTSDGGKGIIEKPKEDDRDRLFEKVEVDASYPGGVPAWFRFLNKNIRYPDDAQANGIQGPVMVQFIVDKEGNVSDVQAISGPTAGGLREEAIRVIRKSGKWVPAIQNGRNVKSYKHQPVIFQLTD
jgi:periplasmic protein TonB